MRVNQTINSIHGVGVGVGVGVVHVGVGDIGGGINDFCFMEMDHVK
jgi:hypothetical protein